MTFKILYLHEGTGELGRLPDGGIVNIGGVAGTSFTVGGKPLMFADGTSTGGGGSGGITVNLQAAYDGGSGTINLSAGKDFIISALNQKIFEVDAETGRVTITGDLTVLGSSTVVEGTLANVDQVSINPPNGTTSGLLIEPLAGFTMSTDLVRIRTQHGGAPVFTIDAAGTTFVRQLTVGTTINGIDLGQFFAAFQQHIDGLNTIKHKAEEISVKGPLTNLSGANVQQVIESIDQKIGSGGGNTGGGTSNIKTHEHVQDEASQFWFITHNQQSMRPTVTIYDETFTQTFADEVKVIDPNTVRVTFSSPQAGRAIILLF